MTTVRSSIQALYDLAERIQAKPDAGNGNEGLEELCRLADREQATGGATKQILDPPSAAEGTSDSDSVRKSSKPVDLGDLKRMVEQALDEDSPSREAVPDSKAGTGEAKDIEQAMQDIAAAVAQASGENSEADIETMKASLVGTMREELESIVRADLMPMVRKIVTEVLAERRKQAGTGTGKRAKAASTVRKLTPKAGIKKIAGTDAKAAAKTTAKKAMATKLPATKVNLPAGKSREPGAKLLTTKKARS